MTALAAEVIWTRCCRSLFGATVYAFALILAVFLLGLGIGASLGAALARKTARPAFGSRLVPAIAVRRHRLDRLASGALYPTGR